MICIVNLLGILLSKTHLLLQGTFYVFYKLSVVNVVLIPREAVTTETRDSKAMRGWCSIYDKFYASMFNIILASEIRYMDGILGCSILQLG